MPPIVYVNGEFLDKEQAKVSVFDHGFLYGDGVFEGIRVYAGRAFELRRHLERLYSSAKNLLLEIPMPLAQMTTLVEDTVRRSAMKESYIRLVVTRGTGDLGIDPRKCTVANVVIIVDHISIFPTSTYATGVRAVTASVRRSPADVLNPNIKSLNYLNMILAKIEAVRAGVEEAIMLNKHGFVAEGSAENVFIVRGNSLLTPPGHHGVLKGITREVVLELAPRIGLTAIEEGITPFDLYSADEAFLSGTGAEIIALVEVDGRKIGHGKPGPWTLKLTEAFRAYVAEGH